MFKSYYYVVVMLSFLLSESPLPDRYHTYHEIDSILHAWSDEFGLENSTSPYDDIIGIESGIIYKLIELGTSTQDNLPFWAVKLSFNADIDEDEPRTLILGQCHAEEILGVEISMELIYRFLHPDEFPSDINTLAGILYESEVWIVPTHNPEGLDVVHGWQEGEDWMQDVSYRKNKMDANHNGIFDFDISGYGNDMDGVDLNRNYDLNWIFGDDFLETDAGCPSNPSYVSNYDYYRGESPFSESEIIAIRDLVLDYDFVLSIAYHSSRSGCVSERVIYPWLWEGKVSPDYEVIQPLGQEIAELTTLEIGSGNYHFAPSGSRKGNAHDWFYARAGCIQYLIEVGTENMQPESESLIEDTIDRNLPGAYHLMKRAAGMNGPEKYQVTGIVTDANTGEALEDVEVVVESMSGGVLSPRKTNQFGRYQRLLSSNVYNLLFKKPGYEIYSYDQYVPSADIISDLDVQMVPKEFVDLAFTFEVPENHPNPIYLNLYGEDEDGDDYSFSTSNQEMSFSVPVGDYRFELISEGLYPLVNEGEDTYEDFEEHIPLKRHDISFEDNFENMDNWEIVFGDWNVLDGKLLSQDQEDLAYSFSPAGPIRVDSQDYFFTGGSEAILQIEMKYELEWDNDTLFVDIIDNEETSQRVFSKSDQLWENNTYNIPVNQLDGKKLSIGIIPDITVGYRGVSIESMRLIFECMRGDLNHDGEILVTDIVTLVNIILDDSFPEQYLNCSGDMNEDGNLDIYDIISILAEILGG